MLLSCFTCVLASLTDGDLQRLEGATANDFYRDGLADAVACQDCLEIVRVVDSLVVEADYDVAEQDAATLCRAILVDFNDEQAMFLCTPRTLVFGKLYQLAADPQVATFDVALLCQGFSDIPGDGSGNCKRNTADQTRSCYAKHGSLSINQWAT